MRFDLRGYLMPVLLLASSLASADTWSSPEQAQYVSANGLTRVTITPGPLDHDSRTRPLALLEQRDAEGVWRPVWNAPLVNDVAPVHALVTNGGEHLVTFDNWHSMGHGPDAVVVYDQRGKLVRKLALKDFLPSAYIAFLPRSVSSLWWGGDHYLDEEDGELVLQVNQPDSKPHQAGRKVDVRIRLANGEVLPHEGGAWTAAMVKLRELDEGRQQRWRELRALRAMPLEAPRGNDASKWRDYMVELRARLTESSGDLHAGVVLPAPGDADHAASADRIRRMLDRSAGHFVFVSPSPEALARVLAEQFRSIEPGAMEGARITFVGMPTDGFLVEAAAAGSGADIVLLDIRAAVPGMVLRDPIPEWFR